MKKLFNLVFSIQLKKKPRQLEINYPTLLNPQTIHKHAEIKTRNTCRDGRRAARISQKPLYDSGPFYFGINLRIAHTSECVFHSFKVSIDIVKVLEEKSIPKNIVKIIYNISGNTTQVKGNNDLSNEIRAPLGVSKGTA